MANAVPTLYVCHGDDGGPRVHPCRRVQEALRAAGIGYEKVIAAHAGHAAVAHIEVDGHIPRLRTGIHVGRPRRLGGDYFGVDVNVAARVASAARGGEVLVTESVPAHLDPARVSLRQRSSFQAKGTPEDLRVYVAEPALGAA